MIHWSSHLIYVTFRFCSFPSTRLIIFVLFFTDIVSWWLLLEVPASMILTTSTMSAESFWISSQSSTLSLKGTSSVQLTRRTLEFKWRTRRRVGRPHGLRKLESWYRGEKQKLKFGMPRIWWESTDPTNNCYFCMVVVTGHHRGKKTDVFNYPDLPYLFIW